MIVGPTCPGSDTVSVQQKLKRGDEDAEQEGGEGEERSRHRKVCCPLVLTICGYRSDNHDAAASHITKSTVIE